MIQKEFLDVGYLDEDGDIMAFFMNGQANVELSPHFTGFINNQMLNLGLKRYTSPSAFIKIYETKLKKGSE